MATAAYAAHILKCQRSLHYFVKNAWAIVEPNRAFVDGWHVRCICDHLEAVSRGDISRLLINCPPGCMKSLLVSVFYPAWQWITNPAWRSLYASYDAALSMRDSMRCRDIVRSD